MRSWGAVAQKRNNNKMKPFGFWYDDKGIKHYGVQPKNIIDQFRDLAEEQYDMLDAQTRRRLSRKANDSQT